MTERNYSWVNKGTKTRDLARDFTGTNLRSEGFRRISNAQLEKYSGREFLEFLSGVNVSNDPSLPPENRQYSTLTGIPLDVEKLLSSENLSEEERKTFFEGQSQDQVNIARKYLIKRRNELRRNSRKLIDENVDNSSEIEYTYLSSNKQRTSSALELIGTDTSLEELIDKNPKKALEIWLEVGKLTDETDQIQLINDYFSNNSKLSEENSKLLKDKLESTQNHLRNNFFNKFLEIKSNDNTDLFKSARESYESHKPKWVTGENNVEKLTKKIISNDINFKEFLPYVKHLKKVLLLDETNLSEEQKVSFVLKILQKQQSTQVKHETAGVYRSKKEDKILESTPKDEDVDEDKNPDPATQPFNANESSTDLSEIHDHVLSNFDSLEFSFFKERYSDEKSIVYLFHILNANTKFIEEHKRTTGNDHPVLILFRNLILNRLSEEAADKPRSGVPSIDQVIIKNMDSYVQPYIPLAQLFLEKHRNSYFSEEVEKIANSAEAILIFSHVKNTIKQSRSLGFDKQMDVFGQVQSILESFQNQSASSNRSNIFVEIGNIGEISPEGYGKTWGAIFLNAYRLIDKFDTLSTDPNAPITPRLTFKKVSDVLTSNSNLSDTDKQERLDRLKQLFVKIGRAQNPDQVNADTELFTQSLFPFFDEQTEGVIQYQTRIMSLLASEILFAKNSEGNYILDFDKISDLTNLDKMDLDKDVVQYVNMSRFIFDRSFDLHYSLLQIQANDRKISEYPVYVRKNLIEGLNGLLKGKGLLKKSNIQIPSATAVTTVVKLLNTAAHRAGGIAKDAAVGNPNTINLFRNLTYPLSELLQFDMSKEDEKPEYYTLHQITNSPQYLDWRQLPIDNMKSLDVYGDLSNALTLAMWLYHVEGKPPLSIQEIAGDGRIVGDVTPFAYKNRNVLTKIRYWLGDLGQTGLNYRELVFHRWGFGFQADKKGNIILLPKVRDALELIEVLTPEEKGIAGDLIMAKGLLDEWLLAEWRKETEDNSTGTFTRFPNGMQFNQVHQQQIIKTYLETYFANVADDKTVILNLHRRYGREHPILNPKKSIKEILSYANLNIDQRTFENSFSHAMQSYKEFESLIR